MFFLYAKMEIIGTESTVYRVLEELTGNPEFAKFVSPEPPILRKAQQSAFPAKGQ